MDKNQDNSKIHEMIFSKNLGSISFDDAIVKTYFFHMLNCIEEEIPVFYLDFDLLYSGYLATNMLPLNKNTEIRNPDQNTWEDTIARVLEEISKKKHLVIVDSLNGFFVTLANRRESGRIINSIIVMLASIGQKTGSVVLVGSISKHKDDGWVLPAIGRHIIQIENMNLFSVRKQGTEYVLSLVDKHNFEKSSVELTDFNFA